MGDNMLVGIDLGTTNSAIAVWQDGEAKLIPNALGDVLTPSAVSVMDNGEIVTGMAARERQANHPKLTATAFKRYIGTDKRVQLGDWQFSAEDLSSFVLKSLKADAEAFLRENVDSAIITVPAYFNDKQRKATVRAASLAGLKVERLINEPTAAALAHGIHELEEEEPFLIFDLGGGTFDVSLVEIFEGIIEVRASAGDNRLGGEDFNDVLVQLARTQIDPWGKWNIEEGSEESAALYEILRATAERVRRDLSKTDSAEFRIVWQGESHSTQVSAASFERESEPLIKRLRDPVLQSLRDSDVRGEDLGKVILVGGATRMPVVRKAVTKMFGRFPETALDPDEAIALGAAVQAGLKMRDAALDEVRLTDVCPFTLGIESAEERGNKQIVSGLFSPIIDRNTVIPVSREHVFSPMYDNQRSVEVRVYQGESRMVANNVFLGDVKLPLPRGKKHEVYFSVRFTYDVSGLLEVDVKDQDGQETRQLVIQDGADELSPKDLEKRRLELAKLKIHPRDEDANASLMARAERCYQGYLGPQRDYIGHLISGFAGLLDTQDTRKIAEGRKELEKALDELEGDRFL
jgi:molecular chaperone HscC